MLNCVIVSPTKKEEYQNLQSLTLPAFLGALQVLPKHAETFLALKKGDLVLKKSGGDTKKISILEAECYIKDDKVIIVL